MEHLCKTLLPSITSGYMLFGHSMGALIAFELAREMRRRNRPLPNHLFVSGMNSPQTLNFAPPYTYDLPDAGLLKLLEQLGAPQELRHNIELQQLLLPLLRIDMQVGESYRYSNEPPLNCPISAWGGADDIATTLEGLEAWREQTTGDFRLRILPGRHQFVNTARKELLAGLSEDWARHRWPLVN
jgi:medium-chain acyl-[acyl-carrier-protein] hydrolase